MHITIIKATFQARWHPNFLQKFGPFLYAVLQKNSEQTVKQKMDKEKTGEGNPYSVHFVDPIKNIWNNGIDYHLAWIFIFAAAKTNQLNSRINKIVVKYVNITILAPRFP